MRKEICQLHYKDYISILYRMIKFQTHRITDEEPKCINGISSDSDTENGWQFNPNCNRDRWWMACETVFHGGLKKKNFAVLSLAA